MFDSAYLVGESTYFYSSIIMGASLTSSATGAALNSSVSLTGVGTGYLGVSVASVVGLCNCCT